MSAKPTVLLLGGTGRTGRLVLQRLLAEGCPVRAVVRSAQKLPAHLRHAPQLSVIEAEVTQLPDAELEKLVAGCDAVASCLGHLVSLKGVLGPPHDLVTRVASRVCERAIALRPAVPLKFVLMSSVSVHRPGAHDALRGRFERAFLAVVRAAMPPALDNQRAADFLADRIGGTHPFVEWVAVRPDTLKDGPTTPYALRDGLVHGVFTPGSTNMANVADFMTQLILKPELWALWKGKMPVLVNSLPTADRPELGPAMRKAS